MTNFGYCVAIFMREFFVLHSNPGGRFVIFWVGMIVSGFRVYLFNLSSVKLNLTKPGNRCEEGVSYVLFRFRL